MEKTTRKKIMWIRLVLLGLLVVVICTCLISTLTPISVENVTAEEARLSGLPQNSANVSLFRPAMISGMSEVFLEFDTDEKSFDEWKQTLNQELTPVSRLPLKINRYDFSTKEPYTFTLGPAAKYFGTHGTAAVDVAYDRKLGRAFMHSYQKVLPLNPE